jgi:SAM-dependent methyltransferase
MASFEAVADKYDAARPPYPDEVFDALGPVDGIRVLDVGAGTGIATRALIARHANVVAIDPGRELLRRATTHTADLVAVVADGAALPVRSNTVDLACFAQAWHWLDPATRVAEVARVVRSGGRCAAWWSHARADGQQWFDSYWAAIERSCPGTHRGQRDTDWGATMAAPRLFVVHERVTVSWIREIPIDLWMIDQASHSHIAGLPNGERDQLTADLRRIVRTEFADGTMVVPYETWLWIGTRI